MSGQSPPRHPAQDHDARLAKTLVQLILVAAVVTAPIFLFGEGFEAKYIGRVAASNGICVILCLGLLALLRKGHVRAVGSALVYGLLALVGALAWMNGEPAQTNVINFVLVTVLAAALLPRNEVVKVGVICATTMICIAWDRPTGALELAAASADDEKLRELRFESIVQFLPTYAVVVVVLRMLAQRGRRAMDASHG